MSASRPDDASGHYFREMLADLRRRLPRTPKLRRTSLARIVWIIEEKPAYDFAIQVATAISKTHALFVVEMRDSFLAGQPLHMPKISWSLQCGYTEDNVVAGSAAPTLEEGQARAEVALRVHLGTAMDG